ncbi:DUF4011 domain-containing protein [Microbacterium sp. NPDC057650]|uniref:DUF4011 domain-containing protein n=1 Tax=unclassified Microbacterium TaxID=2609290 RepID=UPI00367034D9
MPDEQLQVYAIGDASADGVRVQVEYQQSPNLALAASGLPVVRSLAVHNETGRTIGDIRVEGSFAFGQTVPAVFDAVVGGPHLPGAVAHVPLGESARQATAAAFQQAAEASAGAVSLRVAVQDAGSVALDLPVHVLAGNEFLNWPDLHAAVAAFVRPNTRSLTPVLRAASDLLQRRTGSGALEGYQSGPQRAERIAGAVYEALRGKQLTYINPPASFERTGQKVRTVDQVLADRFGTCIDLAVVYAAALEASGLAPVVFLTADHAFAGYRADGFAGETAVVRDPNLIVNLVESGAVVPVELTGINPGSDVKYRKAVDVARRYFRDSFDLVRTMVDVPAARAAGVLPLPSLEFERPTGVTAEAMAAAPDDRPFVAKGSLRGLTLDHVEERVTGTLDTDDPAPPRVKAWKRDLIDLSLRNPLLNMPRTGKTLDLVTPGGLLARIDDVIHSGKRIMLLPADGVDDLARQRGVRVASELAPDEVTRQFTLTRSLFSMVELGGFPRRLRTLQRDAKTLQQETGSNYLYLALGTFIHTKPDGTEARAPLFLLPVQLRGTPLLGYSIEADAGESAVPNPCLVEWLRSTKGVRFPALENPPTDENGLAITTVFTELRRELAEQRLPFRVDESATLAILRFATFQVWHDLNENWPRLTTSPIVDHLVYRPGETFPDPAGDTAPPVEESRMHVSIPADGSQLGAIARAVAGQSFVLEGPPGTGKSQTITNLIAELMRAGKTVLFVAEKQAALEVVKRRLDAIGLGRFTMELHGDKQSMGSIRGQLKNAMDAAAAPLPPTWAAESSRLTATVTELGEYPARVHGRNALGLSLWQAYEQAQALGDGPVADFPLAVLTGERSLDELSRTVADFAQAAARAGRGPHDPWTLVGPEFTAGIDPALLDRMQQAVAAVDALGTPFATLLDVLHPQRVLPSAAYLVRRAQAGQTSADAAHAARSAGELDRISGLRARLVAFAASHGAELRHGGEALFTATDLGTLQAQSAKLDGSWFLPELRRRPIRRRLGELTQPEWAAGLTGEQVTLFLTAAVSAAAEAAVLLRDAAARTSLALPANWAPWHQDALELFDAAAATARAAVTMPDAATVIALLALEQNPGAWLIEIDTVWRAWHTLLASTELTLDAWAGDSWVGAWRHSQATWLSDAQTTGALRPQRAAEVSASAASLAEAGLAGFASDLLSGRISATDAAAALLRGAAQASIDERTAAGRLGDFDGSRQTDLARSFGELSSGTRAHAAVELANTLVAARPFDPQRLRGEVAELRRQIDRKRGGLSFREIAGRYRQALQSIAPCFLMSPGSVAYYLPADFTFDVVVFDEASQIRVPQAIGALGRARSAVIAGDSRQMPPTRIMEVTSSVESSASSDDADAPVVEDLESILDEAVESGLPREWLTWHYRSHDERLIAFSNQSYYGGRLVTLPSPRLTRSDADAGPSDLGLEWRRVDGVFDRGRTRTNLVEAQAIVAEISRRLADPVTRDDSIGVVTFNIQQRDLILDLLEDSSDLQIRAALDRPAGEAIFVKNLESVQGDERDVVLFSLAFSADPATGRVPLQFGPLVLAGGERRLNVAITRARKHVLLFSSFAAADLDLSRSSARGLADLKAYLEFAAGGPLPAVRPDDESAAAPMPAPPRAVLVDQLRDELTARGLVVADTVGLSRFKVDLAVRLPEDETGWRVAVLLDGPSWAGLPTVADRDGSPELLHSIMQWPVVERVWLPGWLSDRAGALDRIEQTARATAPFDPGAAHIGETPDAAGPGEQAVGREMAVPGTASGTFEGGSTGETSSTASGGGLSGPTGGGTSGTAGPGSSGRRSAAPGTVGAGTTGAETIEAETGAPAGAAGDGPSGSTDHGASGNGASDRPGDESSGAAASLFPPSATAPAAAPGIVPAAASGSVAPVASFATRTTPVAPVDFTAFTAAPVGTLARTAILDNPRLAAPAIERYADEILAVEGPTESERLARLIGARFGLSRVVERRRNDILGALEGRFPMTEHGAFVWPRGTHPDTWIDVARTDPSGARTFAEISLHELVNGIVVLLRQAFSMDEGELASDTVKAFGFVRVTPAVRSRLDRAIAQGISAGRIIRDGERYRLPQSTSQAEPPRDE